MKMRAVCRAALAITVSFGSLAVGQEQLGEFECVEPSLNINFSNETQLRLLERDFKAYEACYIEYTESAKRLLKFHQDRLSQQNPDENWANESEEIMLARLQASLTALTDGQEKLRYAEDTLADLISRILEHVPAEDFNEWDVESRVTNR